MTPALFRRLVALGFEPGSMNPEAWAVARLEELLGPQVSVATMRVTGELYDSPQDVAAREVERRRLEALASKPENPVFTEVDAMMDSVFDKTLKANLPALVALTKGQKFGDSRLEALAALEHEQWAHWTRHMLDVLNPALLEVPWAPKGEDPFLDRAWRAWCRWNSQIRTPYADLTEAEKDSDREWARKVLEVLK